ncbi:hypothetical protein RFI_08239 [Reticulomyxa filosa]|uniref:Uncharacterized protein n=1 Tax=Reticulomyxa filosa TaxID=46433 RepID=X6NUG6_RETFI|nr:hypothetical protein RFI_08239 [Reticulomyxa filosa]|eukprot:ETO28887.1 hypothetical protein RFI_08239 [Reticulomyxa filosa]
MFDKNKFSQNLYHWLGLLTLSHEMLLIPRFWFLYFDWRLGMDLNKMEWKRHLFLGKWQLCEQSVVVNKDLNAMTGIATTCNEDKDGSITDKKEDRGKDDPCEIITFRQSEEKTTILPSDKVEMQLMTDNRHKDVAVPETTTVAAKINAIVSTTFSKHERVFWTLRYRSFLGDTRIVLAFVVFYFALYATGSIFMHFLEDIFDSFIYLAVFIVVTNLLLFICAYKIKSCRDLLEIHSFFFLLKKKKSVCVCVL